MRWPTGTQVTSLRQDTHNFSNVYLFVQRGKEETDCAVYGAGGCFRMGCHLQLGVGDSYSNTEHCIVFATGGILVGTDIRPNMNIACGTAADPYAYGSARIRVVDAPNDRIYLEPNDLFANGHFVNGDYIWCDGIPRLARILPYIRTGTVYEDGNSTAAATHVPGTIYPGWGATFHVNYEDRPVALMGSPRVAWTNEYIDFYGWRSFGRGANAVTAWDWGIDGGESPDGLNTSGTPASPVRARWSSSGDRLVTLTVTDDSGKAGNDIHNVPYTQHTAMRPVLVRDKPGEGTDTPYSDFKVNSIQGKYGSGWTASITVYGTADRSSFPDNALIIIYADDWYGGTQDSVGGWYGQEGILFVGYIRGDSIKVDFEKSSVSFEAATIEQWMKDISCWPVNFISTAGAATAWHEFQTMVVEDCMWFLAEMRSNLKDVTDCFMASDVNAQKTLGFLDITEASLYDQLSNQIGSCFYGQVSSSRHGSIHLFKHKNMMDLAERVFWGPPIWSFATQDWHGEIEVGEERMRDSVAQVDYTGFIYDANGDPQDVYALAPARQSAFGRVVKESGILLSLNIIALAQPECNTLAGLFLAWQNIRFPNIRVHARNNRFLEPATLDYFAVTLASTDWNRGYTWAAKEFLTTGVTYQLDHKKGILLADIEGEASVWGPDGVAGEYPAGGPSGNPPDEPNEYWDDGDVVEEDPPPWWPVAEGECAWAMIGMGVATSANGFWVMNNAVPPYTWSALNGGLDGNWLNMRDADGVVDSDGHVTVYAATQAGICKLTGCTDDWVQLTLPNPTNSAGDDPAPIPADLDYYAVQIDLTDSDIVHVAAGIMNTCDDATPRTWYYRTPDGGITWTSTQLYSDLTSSYVVELPQPGPDILDVSEAGLRVWICALPCVGH